MRHGNKINHLGRKTGHRTALLKNMSASLIKSKRISTTLAKAKVLRTHLEPLITKAVKQNTTHSRRTVFSYLQDKEAVKELFGIIAEKIGDRPGGYLRVIKTGNRLGDGAETALIEFVDFNDSYVLTGKSDAKKKRTRRSGTAAKKTDDAATKAETKVVAPVATDEVVQDVELQAHEIVEEESKNDETSTEDSTTEETGKD